MLLLSCSVSGRWLQCSGSESWWRFRKLTSPAYTTMACLSSRSDTRTDQRRCHVTGRSRSWGYCLKGEWRMMLTGQSRFGWRSECSSSAKSDHSSSSNLTHINQKSWKKHNSLSTKSTLNTAFLLVHRKWLYPLSINGFQLTCPIYYSAFYFAALKRFNERGLCWYWEETRSSATAERQRVSCTRLSRLTHWSRSSLNTASVLQLHRGP